MHVLVAVCDRIHWSGILKYREAWWVDVGECVCVCAGGGVQMAAVTLPPPPMTLMHAVPVNYSSVPLMTVPLPPHPATQLSYVTVSQAPPPPLPQSVPAPADVVRTSHTHYVHLCVCLCVFASSVLDSQIPTSNCSRIWLYLHTEVQSEHEPHL